jgi:S1-C subfamily serine protease
MYSILKKSSYLFLTQIFFVFLTIGMAHSKGAPESFADLAEKLSPSVVNISTTTIIEQKSREMPSFPLVHLLKIFLNNLKNLEEKNVKLNH